MNPSVYVGSDDHIYLKLDYDPSNTYYTSFSLFEIEAANGGSYSTNRWDVIKSDSCQI